MIRLVLFYILLFIMGIEVGSCLYKNREIEPEDDDCKVEYYNGTEFTCWVNEHKVDEEE